MIEVGARKTSVVKSFRGLIVWQEAMKLATMIYLTTKTFPKEELYSLVSQVRRSAVSISANIAEGWARNTRPQFCQFLYHALASLAETESHTELAFRLQFLNNSQFRELSEQCNKTGFLLRKLINSLNAKEG